MPCIEMDIWSWNWEIGRITGDNEGHVQFKIFPRNNAR
jgi:hypothetical protein